MDIKITESSLKKFLVTDASTEILSENISLCGPTFDRIHKIENDYLYEIEAITNRIDTASAQGVAREAATILTQFGIPAKMINDPYKDEVQFKKGFPKQFHFDIPSSDLVVRFVAIALSGISIRQSPQETQDFLSNCGQRPLNNAVDITNELTILYGMPSHIFDLDKLATQKLSIRESKKDEILITLDDTKNRLRGGDIVIEDGSGRLVDLCGVMGGQIAEVDEHTKNILLIVPVYHPKKIRQTSLYLQKRTLASQLYEKQPDPELCLPVLNKAINLFKERAGAEVSSDVFDFYPNTRPPKIISLDLSWLNKFIGITIPKEQVFSILNGLGFSGTPHEEENISCLVPSFRYHDINIKEDLAEEIARIYGYFRLPSILPTTMTSPEPGNKILTLELKTKKYLANIGYHETYNNSLISQDLITITNLKESDHIKLANALSSDYEYLRTSLIPSLLQNLRNNQGKTEGVVKIMEISNIYLKTGNKELPDEISTLALLSTGDYRTTKGDLESLFRHLNIFGVTFKIITDESTIFDNKISSEIFAKDGSSIGKIGLVKPIILNRFGLTSNPVLVEANFSELIKNTSPGYVYRPISEYPEIIESITIQTDGSIGDTIAKIYQIDSLVTNVKYTESYKNKHTFKISFGSFERNLEQKEVNEIKLKILQIK